MPERFGIKRNSKNNILIYPIVFILSIFISFMTITNYIEPTLIELCRVKAESIGISNANKVVETVMRYPIILHIGISFRLFYGFKV